MEMEKFILALSEGREEPAQLQHDQHFRHHRLGLPHVRLSPRGAHVSLRGPLLTKGQPEQFMCVPKLHEN